MSDSNLEVGSASLIPVRVRWLCGILAFYSPSFNMIESVRPCVPSPSRVSSAPRNNDVIPRKTAIPFLTCREYHHIPDIVSPSLSCREYHHIPDIGLYGSLGEQEQDLLDELRAAAEPLVQSCTPEVGAGIEAAVQEAVTAWTETCQSLLDLCNRYQDAVRLWQQYRDASDAVKTWTEQQLDSVACLSPEDALNQVKSYGISKELPR
uniref:Uncharacterized protein n=1 Tax=Timema genevievae TaxID=629358 RepID=A0A7R9K675_TIMGE|nr:unnamed protein product [Timema genevievae]